MKKFMITSLLGLFLSHSVMAATLINGAGATFPFPLYSKWFSTYNKMHPDVQINYQSIGSGGGIKQITERTVDFGASDAPLTDAEMQKAGIDPGLLRIAVGLEHADDLVADFTRAIG